MHAFAGRIKHSSSVQLKKEDMNAEYLLANYLDNSNDLYWVDEYATPLSVLEIRDKIIEGEFCTPVSATDNLSDLQKSLENNQYCFFCYVKKLVALEYMENHTVGETQSYYLLPVTYATTEDIRLISREAVEAAPVQ